MKAIWEDYILYRLIQLAHYGFLVQDNREVTLEDWMYMLAECTEVDTAMFFAIHDH